MEEPVGPGALPAPGRTVITETAVAKVAAIAARSVPGVFALGAGTAQLLRRPAGQVIGHLVDA